jgi:site-specific DNA-cytosine methylase
VPRSRTRPKSRTASHRPAVRRRRFRHDELIAVDLFSGFGGLTEGIRRAGFTTIMAANHNDYKVRVHEANHPDAEHWIADLVDPDSSDYHSAADLPSADILVAGISCTNHSGANTQKAYEQGLTLFDIADDEEYAERVTRSEKDRATALCVLQYAEKHHPRMMLIECTTEFTSWGPALPGKKKVGDGSTYRWWRQQIRNMKYRGRVLYLNSQFFGVSQSRDRIYMAFWDESVPEPDLDHRPATYCRRCDEVVPAVWSWKTGVPPSGTVRYGQQYNYRCPRCTGEVVPPMTPSVNSIDFTNLGTRIGDKPDKLHQDGSWGPMARSTMGRAARCFNRLPDFPPVMLPARTATHTVPAQRTAGSTALAGNIIAAHRHNGDGQHISRPMDTITSTHEKGLLLAAVDNYQGAPRGLGEPLPTQGGSETMALVSAGVAPLRNGGIARGVDEPLPAVTASETLSLVSAGVLPFRRNTVPTTHAEPMPTVTADQNAGLLSAQGQLISSDARTAPQVDAEWLEALRSLKLEDCYFRMLFKWEIGRACDFDVDFPGHEGTFVVWGTAQQQIDGYGNAVSPGVGKWLGMRLRPSLTAV